MQTGNIVLLMCALGFSFEFRPSEPFITPYLNGPKNFTSAEINNEIFPIATYSNMSLLIAVFLLTDWLRYKPVLIMLGLSGVTTWSLITWFNKLFVIQLSQVTYGLLSACEVSYSSYLYAIIDKKHYQRATGQTKAATLVAKASSGFISQLLITYKVMEYEQLNYITLGAFTATTLLSAVLPPVKHSYYFNRSSYNSEYHLKETLRSSQDAETAIGLVDPITDNAHDKPYSLLTIFQLWMNAMKNKHTLKWSVWAAFSMCGYLQVNYYIQLLWQELINSGSTDGKLYHGFSIGSNALLGALCTYCVGYLKVNWTDFGEIALAASTLALSALLLFAASCECTLIVHYIINAAFKVLYQSANTIASSEIAKSLNNEAYGLVFGVNQFIALVLQSLLTVLVTKVFNLSIRTQFNVYGSYFLVLGIIFIIIGSFTLSKRIKRQTAFTTSGVILS